MTPSESDFGQLLEARTGAAPRRSGREYIGLCPVHGDKHPSLSFREGDNGKILTVCRSHACSHGDIAGAIGWEGDIGFDSKISSDRPPRARYDYHDAAGKLIASKVRRDTDEAGKKCYWEPKLNGRAMPLYRLPEVLKARAAGERVFLCEGERDAETLRGFGLVATTSPHGAIAAPNKWLPAYTDTLAGCDVVIVPDNDEPGRSHARNAANAIRENVKSLRVLAPFDIPGVKGADVSDAVERGLTREAFLTLVEAAPPEAETIREATPEPEASGPDAAEGREPSAAAQLIEMGRKALLFHDERGDGYAAFTSGPVRRILKLRSADFSSELCRRFAEHHAFKKAANGEAVASARNVLEGIARHQGEEHQLANRFAHQDGAVWIDIGDKAFRAIKVTPGRWEIVETPPLLFRRFSHQRPLAEPKRGGNLRLLLQPFDIPPDEQILILAFVVSVAVGNIPRPLLLPHGPQGSGKSTLLKMISSVLDPSGTDDLDLGGEARELAQNLDQHALPFFDNVVKIQDWQARLLCKAITGGGFEKRRLFTDEDSVIQTFQRAVLVSAINIPTSAPDLLDRSLLVAMNRISPDRRCREEVLWQTFNARRGEILGGVLDTLAEAMTVLPTLALRDLPRMADFATWGAACAEALGEGAETFLRAYRANVGRQTEEILESDPVARAVLLFLKPGESWSGTASMLLAALTERNEEEAKARDSGWPKRGDGLSRRLRVLHSTLADAGVDLGWSREGKERTRTITVAVRTPRNASPASPASAGAGPRPNHASSEPDAEADTSVHGSTGVRCGVRLKSAQAAGRGRPDAADVSSYTFTGENLNLAEEEPGESVA